jgi:hypothetical protein
MIGIEKVLVNRGYIRSSKEEFGEGDGILDMDTPPPPPPPPTAKEMMGLWMDGGGVGGNRQGKEEIRGEGEEDREKLK